MVHRRRRDVMLGGCSAVRPKVPCTAAQGLFPAPRRATRLGVVTSSASDNRGNIVVGVDGSPTGELAVLWAAEEARLQHRGVTLVHARKPLSANRLASFTAAGISAREVTLQGEREAERLLERARALAPDRLVDNGVETLFYTGDARRALLDLSDSASMVVVGSRGHGRVVGLMLGSVSGALVRHAPCRIAVIRPTSEGRRGYSSALMGRRPRR